MSPAATDPPYRPGEPAVAAILLVESGSEHELPLLVERLVRACGRRPELILVDLRLSGEPVPGPWGCTLKLSGASRGEAWIAGAEAARSEFVVLLDSGAHPAEGGIATATAALEAAPESWAATGAVRLVDGAGESVGLAQPCERVDAPAAGWLEATVWRREVVGGMNRAHFHPVELELFRDLQGSGRLLELERPLTELSETRFTADSESLRRNAALLGLCGRTRARAELELSVIVHGGESLQNIERTLASLGRQLLRPGTFEIVLAAQPESAEGARALSRLRPEVPFVFVHTEGTPGAVLEAALSAARAPHVLFLRSGSIAEHDLVERHLRFHRLHERSALMGGLTPPSRGVELALSRYLSTSDRGVPRRTLESREAVPPEMFECSNLSLRRGDLAAVGGPDPAWICASNCDIDLGARLERSGLHVSYRPEARVALADRTAFEGLAESRLESWKERARLYLRHPQLVRRSTVDQITPEQWGARLQELDAVAIPVEAAAAELGAMDVGSLERLGSEFASVALEAMDRLAHLLGNLEERWCLTGLARGLEELGFGSMGQLIRVAESRIPELDGRAGARLLAWPDWSDEAALRRLVGGALPLADVPGGALFLRAHPDDPAASRAPALLQRVVAAVFPDGEPAVQCVCLAGEIKPEQWLRLSAEFSGLWITPGVRQEELRHLFAPCLLGSDEVDAWCGRFESPHVAATSDPSELELELSVLVLGGDSPAAVDASLMALAAQDLEPERFEVLIAETAEHEPLEPRLTPGQWPFDCAHVRLPEADGPAAARNLALERARGRVVLFLDAEARPAPSCLRLHLEAQAGLQEPRAVQGATPIEERHRGSSLVEYCERTGLHVGRPPLKPGLVYGGAVLSANNVSLERSHLIAVGGFDASFPFAGGEETDLGLRLDAALGLKVLHLPAIQADLDRPLDPHGFARDQRILGWSAYRIAVKHDNASLAFGGAETIDDTLIGGLISDLRGTEPELEQHLAHLERHAATAAGEAGPDLRETIERVAFLEYARGLAAAHRDRLPFEEESGAGSDATFAEEHAPLGDTSYTRMVLAHAQRLAEREARDSGRRPTSDLLVQLPETLGDAEAGRLYELARRARGGAILALGCGGTRAAVALGGGTADGLDLRVYAVQPEVVGCAEARESFLAALRETGSQRSVRLLDLDLAQLAAGWSEPIGMIVLGDGVEGGELELLGGRLAPEAVVCALGSVAAPAESWLASLRSEGFAEDRPAGCLREFRRA